MTPHLELMPPNQLRYAGRSVPVGATVYLAVRALIETGGRLPRGELCRQVWGTDAVAKRTVWSLCHRVSERLGEVGYPGTCGTDGGDVLLC